MRCGAGVTERGANSAHWIWIVCCTCSVWVCSVLPSMHCLVRQTALKRSGQLCAALWPLSIIAPQTPCPRLLKTDEQRLHLLHGCAQRRCMLGRLEQHACRVGMPGAQLQLSLAELRQPLLFSPPLQCAATSSASSPSC